MTGVVANPYVAFILLILAMAAFFFLIMPMMADFDWALLVPSTIPNPTRVPMVDPAIFVVEPLEAIEPVNLLPNGDTNGGEHTIHGELNQDIKEKSHAAAKHSAEAESVRECLGDYGSMHIFFNPQTKRYANICFMPDSKYGIQIAEDIGKGLEEVTSFIKNKFKTWGQMARYLENSGYTNMVK